jgi:hypothetical protein
VIPTDLKFNVNGPLDLYIQNEKPGAVKVSNWLPALKNGSMLRLYALPQGNGNGSFRRNPAARVRAGEGQ